LYALLLASVSDIGLIIDKELNACGTAGDPDVYRSNCPGSCNDLVLIPSTYNEAYFEINYIKVFQPFVTGDIREDIALIYAVG
jgi:hypothetical protein